MGDPSEILASTLAQPVAQIYYNSLGKSGGIFFTVCGFIIIKFVCFTAMQALGRTVFAFSRDRLLPLSNVWVKINSKTGTPLYAVWICVFFCIAINLIGLGSYAAISGVFNICAIALDWSYIIPIICKLSFGKFKPGPWHMGPLSKFVNFWACAWTLFVTIIFLLPTAMPVAADTVSLPPSRFIQSTNHILDELCLRISSLHPRLRRSLLVYRWPKLLHGASRRGSCRGRAIRKRGTVEKRDGGLSSQFRRCINNVAHWQVHA